jgi:hypothetical protein
MGSGSIYSRLTRLQRVTLVLFVIVLFNWLMQASTGYSIAGGDLLTLFFIIFLVLLSLSLLRPFMQTTLRRLRNGRR